MLGPLSEYLLEVVEGPEAGRQIRLAGKSVEIGRDPGVDIVLEGDSLVSRRHARLTPTSGGVIVEDLESSNGTFLNGDEIHVPALLTVGRELTIGVRVLELRTPAQAEKTSVRPVPAGLTAMQSSPVTPSPPPPPAPAPGFGLAATERAPDYVPPDVLGSGGGASPLNPLLDIHTKRMARTAPLALFVLVVLVVIVALALR